MLFISIIRNVKDAEDLRGRDDKLSSVIIPFIAANVKDSVEYNFFKLYTGSGKMYFNE